MTWVLPRSKIHYHSCSAFISRSGPLPIRANRYLLGGGGVRLSSSAGCQGSGTGLRCQICSEWDSDEVLGCVCLCWRLSRCIGRSTQTVFVSSRFSTMADLSHCTWLLRSAILGSVVYWWRRWWGWGRSGRALATTDLKMIDNTPNPTPTVTLSIQPSCQQLTQFSWHDVRRRHSVKKQRNQAT